MFLLLQPWSMLLWLLLPSWVWGRPEKGTSIVPERFGFRQLSQNESRDCEPMSIVGDATYCMEGPLCAGSDGKGRCPQKGHEASGDCHAYLKSYNATLDRCVLPEDTYCMRVKTMDENQVASYGCSFLESTCGIDRVGLYGACSHTVECSNYNGHALVCNPSSQLCECPVSNSACRAHRPRKNFNAAQNQQCNKEQSCHGHGQTCLLPKERENDGGAAESMSPPVPCTECSEQLACYRIPRTDWAQCMTESQCELTKSEAMLGDYDCNHPIFESEGDEIEAIEGDGEIDAVLCDDNSKSPLFGVCSNDTDCGDFNGHNLTCHAILDRDQDIKRCHCSPDNERCLLRQSYSGAFAGQGDICNATVPCRGHGYMCNAYEDSNCATCQEELQCFFLTEGESEGNQDSNGLCLTRSQCQEANKEGGDTLLNCKPTNSTQDDEKHEDGKNDDEDEEQDKKEEEDEDNDKENDNDNDNDDEKDEVKAAPPRGIGIANESLSVQIIVTIIVGILFCTLVVYFVYRHRTAKNGAAFKQAEFAMSIIQTPELGTPVDLTPAIESTTPHDRIMVN